MFKSDYVLSLFNSIAVGVLIQLEFNRIGLSCAVCVGLFLILTRLNWIHDEIRKDKTTPRIVFNRTESPSKALLSKVGS